MAKERAARVPNSSSRNLDHASWSLYSSRENSVGVPAFLAWDAEPVQCFTDTFAFIAADGFSCLIPAPGLCPYSCSGGGFLNGQSQFAASEPDLFSQICISLDRLLCHDHSSSFTDWSLCSRYVTIKESCQPLFCLMKRS